MTTDRLLSYANGAYLLCVIFAALFSVVLWRLSIRSSEEAGVQITAANSRAAVADERAAEASRDAAHAIERAAALEKEAALARERTALTEQEVERLKFRIADFYSQRVLSEEQKALLQNTCRDHPGVFFDLGAAGGINEPIEFAESIGSVLRAAGWIQKNASGMIGYTVDGYTVAETSGDPGVEVLLRPESVDSYKLALRDIYSAFQQIAPGARIAESNEHFSKDVVHIVVGPKTL